MAVSLAKQLFLKPTCTYVVVCAVAHVQSCCFVCCATGLLGRMLGIDPALALSHREVAEGERFGQIYMLAMGRAAGIRVLGPSRQLNPGEHTPVELQLKYTILYLEVGTRGDLVVTRIAPSSSSYMPG